MKNFNLKTIKPQFMAQTIQALRGDRAIKQTVSDLRMRFNVQRRAFDKPDFLRICKSEAIHVVRDFYGVFSCRKVGIYLFYEGAPILGVNPKLQKRDYLKVAFHELGHHFLHGYRLKTRTLFKEPLTLNRHVIEAQANYFSDLMLSEVKNEQS